MLILLNYLDLSKIHLGKNLKISGIQPIYEWTYDTKKYENAFLVLTLVKFLALERLPQKQLNDGYLPTMRLY